MKRPVSHSESTIEPVADVRTTRIVLALLVALWASLALWTWRHGATLLDVAAPEPVPGRATGGDDPNAARVLVGGALPEAVAPDAAAAVSEIDGASDPDTVAERDGASDAGPGDGIAASATDASEAEPSRAEPGAGGAGEATAALDADGPTDAGGAGESSDEVADGADATLVAGTDEGAGGVESLFELRRREEIGTLSRLLETLRFEPLGGTPSAASREPLVRAFEILFLYPDTRLALVVESRESDDATSDRRLSRERGETVVDYLVSRGIERSRLSAAAGDGGGLPFGEHRVRVIVEDRGR